MVVLEEVLGTQRRTSELTHVRYWPREVDFVYRSECLPSLKSLEAPRVLIS
jgi:hypothetical protein